MTIACVKRSGAAASAELRRREPARVISPERLPRASAIPVSACTHSAYKSIGSIFTPLFGMFIGSACDSLLQGRTDTACVFSAWTA